MSYAKVGAVVVTCPSCGTSVEADVKIYCVLNDLKSLKIEFQQTRALHECEGRV